MKITKAIKKILKEHSEMGKSIKATKYLLKIKRVFIKK